MACCNVVFDPLSVAQKRTTQEVDFDLGSVNFGIGEYF